MGKPFIPFGCMPGAWGLRGKTREIAKAEYELKGYELRTTIANLTLTGKELNNTLNKLSREYDKITLGDFQIADANINLTGKKLSLRLLELELLSHKKTEREYDKERATINEEPWVHIGEIGYEKDKPAEGSFDLDWNDFFIADLKEAGYKGIADEDIVDLWLNELCKNVAMETYSGTGDFDDDVEEASHIKKQKIDDNKWEAS